MRSVEQTLQALVRSPFRQRFRLGPKDRAYAGLRSSDEIARHARRIVSERLSPAQPDNDGRQTPMRGHPVFVAQHATATCCRSCLAKWHGIAEGHALSIAEETHVVEAIVRWIEVEMTRPAEEPVAPHRSTRSPAGQLRLDLK